MRTNQTRSERSCRSTAATISRLVRKCRAQEKRWVQEGMRMATSDRAVAGAALDAQGAPQARNMRLVGHCPMDNRGDGMHINLKDGYAFFAHMGDNGIGTSVVDVHDPAAPR